MCACAMDLGCRWSGAYCWNCENGPPCSWRYVRCDKPRVKTVVAAEATVLATLSSFFSYIPSTFFRQFPPFFPLWNTTTLHPVDA